MSSSAALRSQTADFPLTSGEVIQLGRQVLAMETRALGGLLGRLDDRYAATVRLLVGLQGSLIVTGMGKAGQIAQKLAATFASTGTRAHFVHPAEAYHGDLGRVAAGDVVLLLSQSGETEEVVQLLPTLRRMQTTLVAITGSCRNTLGRQADITLELGQLSEACSLGLAPSTSTTAMLALGDALALVVSRIQGFQAEDFAQFHPGGALGRQLSHVEDHMRTLEECRTAPATATIRQVLAACTKPGRRTGAIMLTGDAGELAGLFTDSDLVRLLENRQETALDRPVCDVMVPSPTTVTLGDKMSVAIEILAERKISELPVIDVEGRPAGLIDVTDVLGLLPEPLTPRAADQDPPVVRIFPSNL